MWGEWKPYWFGGEFRVGLSQKMDPFQANTVVWKMYTQTRGQQDGNDL